MLPPQRLAALIATAALVVILGFKLADYFVTPGTATLHQERSEQSESADATVLGLSRVLDGLGVGPASVVRRRVPSVGTGRTEIEVWEIAISRKVSLIECNLAVTRASQQLGLEVLDCWEHAQDESGWPALSMSLGLAAPVPGRTLGSFLTLIGAVAKRDGDDAIPPQRAERFRLQFVEVPPAERGVVAVVIDDFGFSWNQTVRQFLEFPEPLTFAVLPGLRSSGRVADFARDRGYEVILHMPMEPESYPRDHPGPDAIMVDDRPAEVRARLRRAFKSVGEITGISNHMGSLVTTDGDVMRVVLDEIGDHGLFFLDSRTSAQSIACQEARRMGVPCVANRLFLDHDGHSRKAIRDHLREAMRIALETHEVLVIGHAYPETYEVLYEAREEFEEKGLRLVTVSELLSPREVLYSGRMPGSQHD